MTETPQPPTPHHEVSLEISNGMEQLFGRGPTRARTYFAGPDMIVCSLEKTFTPAERTMAEMGEHQRLRETRLFFQHAREDDFRETVQRITGRRVRGFLSATDTQEDISCEVFYLEPSSSAAAALEWQPSRGSHRLLDERTQAAPARSGTDTRGVSVAASATAR
jgi:uncharacterized protein YbcI